MKKISFNDILFATLTRQGRVLASLTISGVTSIADVIRRLRRMVDAGSGLVVFSLRNMTQGWSQQSSFMPGKVASRPVGQSAPVQLSLF